MDRKLNSILDELDTLVPRKDRDMFIESRAQQVIASAVNLFVLLEENYDETMADELKRRLINAIKSGDEMKFRRKIQQLKGK